MFAKKKFSPEWMQNVYFLVALMLGIIMFSFARRDSNADMEQLLSNELSIVGSTAISVELEMDKIVSGLQFLGGHSSLQSLWEDQRPYSLAVLKQELAHFANISKKFDQIRIMDKSGMEVLRVNYDDRGAQIVPEALLQDKSDRYYVKESLGLKMGQIYISPFDLNVEHGKLEIPFKPMLRAASPVADASGDIQGLLVVNFLGRDAIENLAVVSSGATGSLMFLNAQGQWLFGGPRGADWAFMFSDREQTIFQDKYPNAWKHISENESGQFKGEKGLYTFRTISLPSKEVFVAAEGSPIENISGRSWKLVSVVPERELQIISNRPYAVFFAIYLLLLIVLGLITEAKRRKDKELKVALSELETLFENSSIGIAYLKNDRIFNRVNPRLCEIIGYSPAELIGKTTRVVYDSSEVFTDIWEDIEDQIKSGKIVQREIQCRHKDGHLIWCNITGNIVAPSDLESGVIWFLEDISERKELERLRSDVDRIMRHDLKAPLTGIINFPAIIAAEGNLSTEQLEHLDLIEESGMRMLSQVNLSLHMYKIETGTYEYESEEADIVEVLRKQCRYFKRSGLIYKRDLILLFNGKEVGKGDSLTVNGRMDFCHIIFSNIIKNALEASPKGETVTISIHNDLPPRVVVHNMGAVPAEIRDDFFAKYSTSGKDSGFGLGTYSVRMLMEAQQGAVYMTTSEASGTTITAVFSED